MTDISIKTVEHDGLIDFIASQGDLEIVLTCQNPNWLINDSDKGKWWEQKRSQAKALLLERGASKNSC